MTIPNFTTLFVAVVKQMPWLSKPGFFNGRFLPEVGSECWKLEKTNTKSQSHDCGTLQTATNVIM